MAARKCDLNLLVFVGRSLDSPNAMDAAQNRVYEYVARAPVDGVILAAASLGVFTGPAAVHELCSSLSHLPCCCISMEVPGIPSVIIDNVSGTRKLVDHLIETHQCKRIGYIRGPLNGPEADQRAEGYLASLAAHGINFDPNWLDVGDFWVDQGREAALRLIDRNTNLDALIAANDHMAFGALEALSSKGIRVPQDILVAGFDDVPAALMASPSLTSMRQSLLAIGAAAMDMMLAQLAGKAVPKLSKVDVQLVTRQSCGCAYRLQQRDKSVCVPRANQDGSPDDPLLEELRSSLLASLAALEDAPEAWVDRLLGALSEELSGRTGSFLLVMDNLLESMQLRPDLLENAYSMIASIHDYVRLARGSKDADSLENLWFSAAMLVGRASTRSKGRQLFGLEEAQDRLRRAVERVSTSLGTDALSEVLTELLPKLDIRRAAVSTFTSADNACLRPLLVLIDGEPCRCSESFDISALAPSGFLQGEHRRSHVVLPITFVSEQLGIGIFEFGQNVSVSAMLREQIGAALKVADLHRTLVREAAARVRYEREGLDKELEIARQLQIDILPRTLVVPGLEIAAIMRPASEVGGDYYDVLPTVDSCWIGVGDVAGHGLSAGLLMLMIQSMVSSLVHANATTSPSTIVNVVNTAFWENVRHRLERDDYVTFVLLRFEPSGALTFAGCHEEILLWRARSRSCERITTSGVWIGITEDTRTLTSDVRLSLEPGDLLVLFTDGITEAMNSRREQFGVARLITTVDDHLEQSADKLCSAIFESVSNWSADQMDDMTAIVIRYQGG